MTVIKEANAIMAEDHALANEEDLEPQELRGTLSKWTNYIHGWQDRYIVLKDATLSYYRTELESHLGCRGALSLKRATVKAHEFDECRFDVSVNDCVWYLRANTPEEKQHWVDVLDGFKNEYGYGTGSESSIGSSGHRRQDSGVSVQSAGTPERGHKLSDKLSELEGYGSLLTRQAAQLQSYFELCVAHYPTIHDDPHEPIDAVQLADGGALAPMAAEVREASASFRATCDATLAALQQCGEMLAARERAAGHALARALKAEHATETLRKQLQEARKATHPGPDLEEGPNSTLPDDEFYDAVETGFDKMEEERCARVAPSSVRDTVPLPPPTIDNRLTVHPLWPEIERITTEQLAAAFEGVGGEIGWQLFAEEGDMRMYRREMEVDGMVMDPLKAIHRVRGVSARELCHYFFNPRYRHDWETTLEQMTIVEEISSDAIVFHQTFKRVWPASQRDALFWSHVRAAPAHTYAVVNHSTHNPDYPANAGACLRLLVTVCLACRSEFPPGEPPSRHNITTNIAYCSTVNPGGWAPAGVLRAVYKREYPKFLKRFTQYVTDQCKGKPLAY